MKPAYVKASIYIDFNIENNKEDPKFKVVNHVRIWKYNNIFAKCSKQIRKSVCDLKS